MKSTVLISTIALVAAGFATACTQNVGPDRDDVDEISAALELENGGFTAEDEAIDETSYADIGTFETVDDATDLTMPSTSRMLTVLVLWGHLPRYEGVDPEAFTDWSGSVQVDGGKLRVDRTVAFDKEDHVIPRSDASKVSFISHTLPHIDGLLLHVVQDRPDATLTVSTLAGAMSVSLSDITPFLADHQPLGDGSNGITFVSFENRPGCSDGFVLGRYRKMGPRVGRYHFRVIEDHGNEIGRVRGIYGYSRRLDNQVFFGKYVNLNGEHLGLVGGEYGDGAFAGVWRSDHPAKGYLGGLYWEGRDDVPGRGLAFGHWSEACGQ